MILASALAVANEVMNNFGGVPEQSFMAFEWPVLPSTKEGRSKIWRGKDFDQLFLWQAAASSRDHFRIRNFLVWI